MDFNMFLTCTYQLMKMLAWFVQEKDHLFVNKNVQWQRSRQYEDGANAFKISLRNCRIAFEISQKPKVNFLKQK